MGAEEITGVAVEDTPIAPPRSDDDGADAVATGAPAVVHAVRERQVHRLRELDRRGRLVAAVFAVALALIPLIAFAKLAPDWAPEGDPAMMALRALDVGTSRHPVVGQPSTAAEYVEGLPAVAHPGPMHFYVMALPIRLLGATYGMLLVSLLVSTACLLISAWAVFRQLGPPAGVVAAVILSAITFTTGAASLMGPVSSNFAGYLVFCSMVLLWCLLAGDLLLLPLATGVLAFTAQQHLSSTLAPLVAAAAVGVVVTVRIVRRWRAVPDDRPRLRRLLRWSAVIGLVLWSPIIYQQFFGRGPGNLSSLIEFSRDSDRPTLGLDYAMRQMAHVLGLPPMLGQTELTGHWLLQEVSTLRWVAAAAVLAATVAVGFACRRSDRTRATLAVMALILVAAGLVNGSSVPFGIEMGRLVFYHWAWPLTFFVVLGLALAVLAALRRTRLAIVPWVTPAALGLALAAVVVPAVVNTTLDRLSNTTFAASAPLERRYLDELVDEVVAHRDEIGDQTVVLERGSFLYEGFGPGLSLALIERGIDVRMAPQLKTGVHPGRMAVRDELDSGLLLVIRDGLSSYDQDIPGELIAEVSSLTLDLEAFEAVVEPFEEADEVVLGDDLEQAIRDLPDPDQSLLIRELFDRLEEGPRDVLSRNAIVLRLLRDHPPEQPRLDVEMVDRLRRSLRVDDRGYHLRVFLLDRDELLDVGRPGEIGAESD